MAERSLFFNAVETSPGVFDREYTESDFALYFGSVLSTGILSTEEIPGLSVSVDVGTLNTVVSVGMALMKGHLYLNSTPLTLTHSVPEATLDRIDRIVLRYDVRNQTRDTNAFVKEGMPSATPVPPNLQRDNFIHEISLAQIRVRKNTVQLLPADLIDERLNEDVCGLVTWTPKVPTGQFQAEWDEFMEGIVDEGFATVASVQAVDTKLTSHKADSTSHYHYGVATGTSLLSVSIPLITEIIDGTAISLKVVSASAVNVQIKINALTTKNIINKKGFSLVAGDLKAGAIYDLRYSSTAMGGLGAFILLGEGGEYGNAGPNDVRVGKTFGTEDGVKDGTLIPGKRYATGTFTLIANQPVSINVGFPIRTVYVTRENMANSASSFKDIDTGQIKSFGDAVFPINSTVIDSSNNSIFHTAQNFGATQLPCRWYAVEQ